jgi:Arc/MetJ family transcription regulator
VTTMILLDDDLVAKAGLLTGLRDSALVREALKALIDRESARRLGVLPARPITMMRRRPVEMATEDFG